MPRPEPIPNDQHEWLVRIHPREDTIYVSQNRSVLATQLDGFIRREGECGFFVEETRLISHYCWTINGERPEPIAISNVEQHSWLGYYILFPPGVTPEPPDEGSGGLREESQLTLELRLSRSVAEGIHEDVDLTNFTQQTTKFDLELEVEADFMDQEEIGRKRQQFGDLTRAWRDLGAGHWELFFDYAAEHTYDVQGERGTARIRRGTAILIENAGSPPEFRDGKIRFAIELGPQQSWHGCVRVTPHFDSKPYSLNYPCYAFFGDQTEFDRRRRGFLGDATRFETVESRSLSHVVWRTLEQSKLDLATLRLYDLDHGERGWVPAAGLPTYVALFGRDSLTSAWQGSLVSPDIMRGVLPELVKWQGTKIDDWRDEEPGRMLHEAHTGPLAMLNYTPRARYYGAATTSAFYPVVLAELWHWTGDEEMVRGLLPAALKAIEWKDKYADRDGDGFYEYQTRSQLGNRNQGWKDSPDAIIYEDGTWVPTPIATCEEQGFMYAAKILMSEVLWWLGDKDLARRMFHEANELKKRFNERFWMEDLGYYALGLDPEKRPIRSIASNAGHCVATAIADEALVQRTVARMMSPELFSGWGVRTLSAKHAAYDPYSYHRGSVWPVEQGTFALGFFRWGLIEDLHRLTRAQFEAASLFDFNRVPEVFSGHERDERHPFPAVYPKSDWPQAWSASAVFSMAQALVGLYPYAPLKLLLLDPHLPEWLPELTIRRLHVAGAVVDIRFFRAADGRSDYEVLEQQGDLHVIRQPSPWSFTATWAERLKDVLTSLLPGK